MERKDFLKHGFGFLGMAVVAPSLLRSSSRSATASATTSCSVTNSETAGPFPTHTPSSLVQTSIVGDRTGVVFTMNITIKNTNANCNALSGALVDVWHCDREGNYSEYGGSGMQATNYTTNHFLRGRQTTDANGLVSFTSVFPGWYSGRATHIHVHVYNAAGTSLLVTQIAFPEGTSSAVNTVNAASSYGYTKGMTGYTYNASDNVFSDGTSNELAASVTGSLTTGYVLTHEIYVAGAVLGIGEIEKTSNQIGQNYPNPVSEYTTIPLVLSSDSKVTLQLFDLTGRNVGKPIQNDFNSGSNSITISKSALNLSSGYYIYKIDVQSDSGTFTTSKKMLVK